jgi:hypothetical protein
MPLETAYPQAIIEISVIEKLSFDCKKHVRFGKSKVVGMVLQND